MLLIAADSSSVFENGFVLYWDYSIFVELSKFNNNLDFECLKPLNDNLLILFLDIYDDKFLIIFYDF